MPKKAEEKATEETPVNKIANFDKKIDQVFDKLDKLEDSVSEMAEAQREERKEENAEDPAPLTAEQRLAEPVIGGCANADVMYSLIADNLSSVSGVAARADHANLSSLEWLAVVGIPFLLRQLGR